jgi:glutamate formiminotransferase/glutamate formiminotransferase/formiminotetrahydrofolate cyclodeaminase
MSAEEKLVECVPNFSEGRDRSTIDALCDAAAAVRGVILLDSSMDADHNRAVLTFVGPPRSVVEASVQLAAVAVERIDLRTHSGIHPYIGALDVLPFVPLAEITLEQCAALAQQAAQLIWDRFAVPAYLYEAAARRSVLRNLAAVRKAAATAPPLPFDIGGPAPHPTAGAIAAGARPFLIAFNVNLDTSDLSVARAIARAVRASSGGLPGVKALGLDLASRGIVQVSMNLVDFTQTPIHSAYEAVCAHASALGARVRETEFIGLVPRAAYEASADLVPGLDESIVLEQRLSAHKAAERS